LSAALAVPVWLMALAGAAAAPLVVGAIHTALIRRVRQRTLALIERSQSCEEKDVTVADSAGREA
jgi:hypothetical protein